MSDYFATIALMPDGQLKKIQLEDYLGKFVLLVFYHGDFNIFAKSQLLAFADENEKFAESDCQVHNKRLYTQSPTFDYKHLPNIHYINRETLNGDDRP